MGCQLQVELAGRIGTLSACCHQGPADRTRASPKQEAMGVGADPEFTQWPWPHLPSSQLTQNQLGGTVTVPQVQREGTHGREEGGEAASKKRQYLLIDFFSRPKGSPSIY